MVVLKDTQLSVIYQIDTGFGKAETLGKSSTEVEERKKKSKLNRNHSNELFFLFLAESFKMLHDQHGLYFNSLRKLGYCAYMISWQISLISWQSFYSFSVLNVYNIGSQWALMISPVVPHTLFLICNQRWEVYFYFIFRTMKYD